jgi:hypothetical protein
MTASSAVPDALDAGLERDLLAACDDLQPELQRLLAALVRFPSTLGEEAGAQDYMEGLFQGMGLQVDRFAVDDRELAGMPGYAPSLGHWTRQPSRAAHSSSTATSMSSPWVRQTCGPTRRSSRWCETAECTDAARAT